MGKGYINIDIEVTRASHGVKIKKEELEGMTKKEQRDYLMEIASNLASDVFDYSINIEGWED